MAVINTLVLTINGYRVCIQFNSVSLEWESRFSIVMESFGRRERALFETASLVNGTKTDADHDRLTVNCLYKIQ